MIAAVFAALLSRLTTHELPRFDLVHPDGASAQITFEPRPSDSLRNLAERLDDCATTADLINDIGLAIIGPADAEPAPSDRLAVLVVRTGEQPHATLIFDAQRWHASRARSLLDQFAMVLDAYTSAADLPLIGHSLITDRARDVLPDASMPLRTQRHGPVTDTIGMIAEYAGETKAIEHGSRSWTYRQLWDAANAIAQQLVACGCTVGSPVGVVGGNSFGLVATIVGTWLAGGVLVPLDPRTPRARREVMCDTAKVEIICYLTGELEVSGQTSLKIAPNSGEVLAASSVKTQSLPYLTDENLAYVIFTSGSTGTPKGVLGYHGGLAHFVEWQRNQFDIAPGDRGAQLTAIGFDVVLRSIFLPLISRATLVLPDIDVADTAALMPWLRKRRITYTHLVPTLGAAMLSEPGDIRLPDLRLVFFAGEPLLEGFIQDWRARISNSATIVNLYGPTETTLATCFFVVPRVAPPGICPVGNSLPGSQALVIANGHACGIGEVGEIAIRTGYRSKGYLRESGLDTSCFVPNPWSSDDLYFTGDLGRFKPTGELEILGRRDSQVKLRGVRIELGEIETVLRRQPGVRAAAVAVKPDANGEPLLAAYLEAPNVDLARLTAEVALVLPSAMLPSVYTVLAEIPRTTSGKINRRLLPDPDFSSDSASLVPPATATEAQLVAIWAEVLGLTTVSTDADFFRIGGHSLRAAQVCAAVREQLHRDLQLAQVFAHPVLRDLAAFLDQSPTEQSFASEIPLVHNDNSPLVASAAQRRMWFAQQLDPASAAYNVVRSFELSGPVDIDALSQAVSLLTSRHDVLHTVFTVGPDGEPQPQVGGELRALEVVDLRGLDLETRVAALAEARERVAELPFDLAHEYPIRVVLIRLDDQTSELLIVLHHIATDGASSQLILRELQTLYNCVLASQEPLPEPALSYADFARWAEQAYRLDRLGSELEFWREQLADVQPSELPYDHPRRQRDGGARAGYVSANLGALPQDAAKLGATTFNVALAGLVVLLSQLTNSRDVVVGTPTSGRPSPELDDIVGFFSNTVVLRNNIADDPSFADLVTDVQRTTVEALTHEALNFDQLVEQLNPTREPDRNPIFDVLFVCDEADSELQLDGVQATALKLESGAAHVDLMVQIVNSTDGSRIELEYDRDLFDAVTAQRIVQRYQALLQTALAQPTTAVSELPSMPTEETEAVLTWSQGTQVEYTDTPLHELIVRIARQQPDRPAVVWPGNTLTYRQLDERSAGLAQRIREAGVEPGEAVGVCCDRGPATAIAFLATLRAGCVYAPLNPAYPDERIHSILELAQPKIVLVDNAQANRIRALEIAALPITAEGASTFTDVPVSLDNPSYLIFTSGSTGTPKGVLQTHRTLANLIHWQQREIPPKPGRRIAMFSSFGFDVSLQELGYALATGAELHVPTDNARSDALEFWNFVEEAQINTIFMPTAALTAVGNLSALGERKRAQSLEQIIVAGEELRITPDLRALFTALPHCQLINQYGPSETHVVTSLVLEPEVDQWPVLPTIGQLIDNVNAYILDSKGRLAPWGVVGELFMGGDALAQGYWDREDLTAERFAQHKKLGRLYRTGDLVRLTPNGELQYRGRADNQVKLRGYRIELGEIEVCVAEQPSVEQAAVTVSTGEDRFIVAYVVPRTTFDATALKAALGKELPSYMVPSVFVEVDSIPLNANGKVNFASLPKANRSRGDLGSEYAAPRTDLEKELTRLFEEALHVPNVGIDDDFFELGGHSLRAAALTAQVRSSLGRSLSLRQLFSSPTVRQIAQVLESQKGGASELPELQAHPDQQSGPLASPQLRVWLIEQMGGDSRSYVISIGVRIKGPLDIELLRKALAALGERHPVLRTRIEVVDGDQMQLVGEYQDVLEVADLSTAADPLAAAQASISERLRTPCDPATDPLWRAHLLATGHDEYVFVLALHHLAGDGASLSILARDLAEFYAALKADRRPALPPLKFSYLDWARWQRTLAESPQADEQLEFWREELADLPAQTELPFDRPRPARPKQTADELSFDIEPQTVEKLKRLAQEHRCSMFSILCSAFGALISRYGNQDKIAVGIPLTARFPELDDIVGFFVRTLVLKVDVSNDPSFDDLIARTWRNQRRALSNQDIPFDRVVRELAPQRSANHNPFFQTMVVLSEASEEVPLTFTGVETSSYSPKTNFASFDLTWFVHDQGDQLHTTLKFADELFDRETVELFGSRLARLLDCVAQQPDLPVSALDVIGSDERRILLEEWNATDRAYDNEGCLQELFEAQVTQTPDAPAITQGPRTLTYRELDQAANALAQRLIGQGVREETHVAICSQRSIEALVAVLAVLKAGGAYVPLDPSHPAERSNHIINDCQAALLLAPASVAAQLDTAVPVIAIDDCAASRLADGPVCPAGPSNAAYVIYTSGSTGVPKGVVVEHRSVLNYLNWCCDDYRVSSGAGSPWLSSLSFDLTVTSLYPVLARGGCVWVIESGLELDAGALASVRNASLIKLTPAHLAIVAEALEPDAVADWTHDAIIGGEALEAETLALWHKYAPGTRLINEYGPTEATVGCITYDAATDFRESGSLPIGKPIANMKAYVLDSQGNLAGIGMPGELWLGGVGVARGYLGRDDLTAQRFVPDPFSDKPGARMYRSGDLARWRHDGILEYLGRIDDQVKLRGYRIELGDIEAKLRRCDGVADAVAALVGTGPTAFLAAYVVPLYEQLDLDAIRREIASLLPAYMVPSTLEVIDSIPLSAAGKVDRRALPQPHLEVLSGSFVAPRTATELALTLLWERLLERSPIGVHDDFFELGGHSLLIARMAGAISRELKVQLPAHAIFSAPTIAQLAKQIGDAQREFQIPVVLHAGAPSRTSFFCIHPAGGHVFGFVGLAGLTDPDRPFIALQNPQLEPGASSASSIEELASRYVQEIRAIQPEGPYLIGGWSFGGVVAFEVAQQLQDVSTLCLFDSYLPSTGTIRQLMSDDEMLESARNSEQVVGDDADDLAAMEQTYLNSMRLLFEYQASPYSGKVVIFEAEESDALYDVTASDTWQGIITPAPEVQVVSGDHHSMMREPAVAKLATQLDEALDGK